MERNYPSKANLITKLVEAANAELRVTNAKILGKSKATKSSAVEWRSKWIKTYPLQAPVEVSMIAFEVSILPKRAA